MSCQPCGNTFVSRSTFYQGDCLVEMNKIADKSIDLIITDLPYGTTKNKWNIIIPFEPMWEQYKRVAKKDAAILLFGSGLFLYQLALSNPKMFKYEIIWHKSKSGSSFTAKYRPVQKHENILVFGNGKVKYNPQLEEFRPPKPKLGYALLMIAATSSPNCTKPFVTSLCQLRYVLQVGQLSSRKL